MKRLIGLIVSALALPTFWLVGSAAPAQAECSQTLTVYFYWDTAPIATGSGTARDWHILMLNCGAKTLYRKVNLNNQRDSACLSIPAGGTRRYDHTQFSGVPFDTGQYQGVYAC